jgi:peptide/nickel transport system ATP-binding protein
MALLEVEKLQVHFRTRDAVVRAVDGVSFSLEAGETLAVVGESGCGKSVTSMSILRLLAAPPAYVAGRIMFKGRDLLQLDERSIRDIRGSQISMIFQEPMSCLNPVQTIGKQIGEAAMLHMKMGRRQAREAAISVLHKVGIPSAASRVDDYPHQLSGGMRQRVMIAMALVCSPKLLIADEPTTALDVTIQAQILDLLARLKQESGTAIMLVTHDLGVVAEVAQRVIVMYAGRKVEEAPVGELYANPLHPYTRGLLGAVPKLGSSLRGRPRTALSEIPGLVPSMKKPIGGCAFANRCPMVQDVCLRIRPASFEHLPNHSAACHFAGKTEIAA